MCDIQNEVGLKRLDGIHDSTGIVLRVGVGVQVGIPQVKGPLQICENRLDGPIIVEIEFMLVTLIPIVLVVIKQVDNDMGTLVVLCWDDPTTLDVEAVVGLIKAFSC